ncbi:MAG: J domain-containing protein [Elusimicrobia bacterium]|nr:J domain-containing protein [Elusimicrobiota bacterium]
MEKDCYEILGVPPDAKPEEIKAAYRTLALRRHPDLNAGDPRAGERFMRIQAAYETLGNPYRRARYDLGRSWRRSAVSDASKRVPPRGSGARLLMLVGALIALRGFAGLVLFPEDAFVPEWLLPRAGRDASFRLYVVGMALVFCAAGIRSLRRD